MTSPAEAKIYRLSGICVALVALSFVVPRLVPDTGGGLAGAATAVLVFLAVLAAATLLAVYLLVITLGARAELSAPARWAGLAPGFVLVVGFFLLIFFLRF